MKKKVTITELIDKTVIVKEIKRLIDSCYKICAGNLDFLKRNYPEHYYSIETYKELLSFLDTLEVKEVDSKEERMKEVDLEKELDFNAEVSKFIDTFYKNTKIGHKLMIRRTAKYFYELALALKAKGE